MTDNLKLTAAADRPLAWAEGDSVRYVVATIEASAPKKKENQPAPPIHLALVIDASGSMAGEKLASAKAAALGVADRLRDSDRLSIVSFASDVMVHANALNLTGEARVSIRAAIGALDTRGWTSVRIVGSGEPELLFLLGPDHRETSDEPGDGQIGGRATLSDSLNDARRQIGQRGQEPDMPNGQLLAFGDRREVGRSICDDRVDPFPRPGDRRQQRRSGRLIHRVAARWRMRDPFP